MVCLLFGLKLSLFRLGGQLLIITYYALVDNVMVTL